MKIELKFRTTIEIKDEAFDIIGGEIAKIKPNDIEIYFPLVQAKDNIITDCLKRIPKFELTGYSIEY